MQIERKSSQNKIMREMVQILRKNIAILQKPYFELALPVCGCGHLKNSRRFQENTCLLFTTDMNKGKQKKPSMTSTLR